jgi:lipopolysaccharide export system protein LptA
MMMPKSNSNWVLLPVLLMTLFLPGPVSALNDTEPAATETSDVQFNADRIMINPADSSAELIGNAFIKQEEAVITADKVKIYFKNNSDSGVFHGDENTADIANSIEKIVATGNVRIVAEDIVATADEAVYDLDEGSLVMTGEPAAKIVKGLYTMSAPEIEMTGTL